MVAEFLLVQEVERQDQGVLVEEDQQGLIKIVMQEQQTQVLVVEEVIIMEVHFMLQELGVQVLLY